MNVEEVVNRFALMAGLGSDAALRYRTVCEDAVLQISGLLREEVADETPEVSAAAAALAFYRYTLAQAANLGDGFQAGDVKVTKGGSSVAMAREVWSQASADAAPYLKDGGFTFERIQP